MAGYQLESWQSVESVEIFVCLFEFVLRASDPPFFWGRGDCHFDFKIVIGFIIYFFAFWMCEEGIVTFLSSKS